MSNDDRFRRNYVIVSCSILLSPLNSVLLNTLVNEPCEDDNDEDAE